jgi:integrase
VILIALTGLRRSEALGLHIGDVDFETRTLVVRVKGGATRLLVIPPPAALAIERWLVCPGSVGQRPADASVFGIGPPAFYTSLRRRAAAAGIAGCTPHSLRHSAAQIRRQAGAPLEEVSRLLGHASLATTARYLRRVEPESDEGWEPVASALGIGGSTRPVRALRSTIRLRAGPSRRKRSGGCISTRPINAAGGPW